MIERPPQTRRRRYQATRWMILIIVATMFGFLLAMAQVNEAMRKALEAYAELEHQRPIPQQAWVLRAGTVERFANGGWSISGFHVATWSEPGAVRVDLDHYRAGFDIDELEAIAWIFAEREKGRLTHGR